jgi:hypothetical protein
MARLRRFSTSNTHTTHKHASDPAETLIPQPFHMTEATSVSTRRDKEKVPKLVLSGAWLKAVGFPIGSAAIVTTDRRGELTLHRLGLGLPRRVYVRATKS